MTLLARLRGQDGGSYRAIPVAQDIIDDVRTVMTSRLDQLVAPGLEVIDFEPGYILEAGEVFRLRDAALIAELRNSLRNTATLDRLAADEIAEPGIGGVFGQWQHNGDAVIVGQALSAAHVLRRAKGISLLWHDGNNYVRMNSQGLTIREATDVAVVQDEIRFLTYHTAVRLFDLTAHFQAASDDMLEQFVALDAVHVTDRDAFLANADSWVRTKVSLILRRHVLERTDIETLQTAAERERVEVDFHTTEGVRRVVLPAEKARLKAVLKLLDEDLFSGSLTGDAFVTSSKRRRR